MRKEPRKVRRVRETRVTRRNSNGSGGFGQSRRPLPEDDRIHARARAIYRAASDRSRPAGGGSGFRPDRHERSFSTVAGQRRSFGFCLGHDGRARRTRACRVDRHDCDVPDFALSPGRGGRSVRLAQPALSGPGVSGRRFRRGIERRSGDGQVALVERTMGTARRGDRHYPQALDGRAPVAQGTPLRCGCEALRPARDAHSSADGGERSQSNAACGKTWRRAHHRSEDVERAQIRMGERRARSGPRSRRHAGAGRTVRGCRRQEGRRTIGGAVAIHSQSLQGLSQESGSRRHPAPGRSRSAARKSLRRMVRRDRSGGACKSSRGAVRQRRHDRQHPFRPGRPEEGDRFLRRIGPAQAGQVFAVEPGIELKYYTLRGSRASTGSA